MEFHKAESRQAQALKRAGQALVGGTVGGFRLPPEVTFVAARGQGSRIWDLDGREYVDFVMGSGPLILGHAHPVVVKAVRERLDLGTQYYIVSEPAIALAEEIIKAVPCAETLRYAGSGSEATFYALRLARAYTGRDKILKFEGGYHGHHDYGQLSVTPPRVDYPAAVPDSAGMPRSVHGEVLIAPFNDAEAASALIERHAGELAAVILEPFQRMLAPKPGFLQALRSVTRDLGIVLIFDEVVTGFRLAYGGAQEFYGVVPDMAALGKIIGGGMPVSAVVGKAEIMDLCDSKRKGSSDWVYFSGTLNGNPLGTTAGLATLAELRKPGTYERLREAGQRMRQGLASVVAERGVPAQVLGEGPLSRLLFSPRRPETYRDLSAADGKLGARVGAELLRRGFYINPGANQYLSIAHTDAEIDDYVAAVAEILDELGSKGFRL